LAPHALLHAAVGSPWAGWLKQQTFPEGQLAAPTQVNIAP
jgi:hypothetical protein